MRTSRDIGTCRNANIGTVHIAGAPVVVPAPTIVVTPGNSTQGVALDAPVVVNVATGHLDTVSLSQAGSSTVFSGAMSAAGTLWEMSTPLAPAAHYTVVATATSSAGQTSTSTTTFVTVAAKSRLLTGMTPLNGAVVGVGETIDLRFNTAIPTNVRAALLERIQVTSTPAVMGGWHWLTSQVVHFRPADLLAVRHARSPWSPTSTASASAAACGASATGRRASASAPSTSRSSTT